MLAKMWTIAKKLNCKRVLSSEQLLFAKGQQYVCKEKWLLVQAIHSTTNIYYERLT